jgi:hypothetical protein
MTEKIPYEDCGVDDEMFPCIGKCCRKNESYFMVAYDKICPYCDISSSLPCGTSLMTITVFECSRLDYSKRINK